MTTSFKRVAAMNEAFGNPKGSYASVDLARINAQVANVQDEYTEFQIACQKGDLLGMRDAICDMQVFLMGAQHLMGVDGDADMQAVIEGVMTRFIKDWDDLEATIKMHKERGVALVYTEGEFPKMILKSSVDQPDAPKGKFLKSASYKDTVFPDVKP